MDRLSNEETSRKKIGAFALIAFREVSLCRCFVSLLRIALCEPIFQIIRSFKVEESIAEFVELFRSKRIETLGNLGGGNAETAGGNGGAT